MTPTPGPRFDQTPAPASACSTQPPQAGPSSPERAAAISAAPNSSPPSSSPPSSESENVLAKAQRWSLAWLPLLQPIFTGGGSVPSALKRRAFWIGLLLVTLMAAATPYNDYVLGNTPLIGNHFPIGVFILMASLMLGLNPLLQWLKRDRLSAGELAVIWAMLLCAAAAPSSGLIRYLEPSLIGPFNLLESMPWLKPIASLLPSWAVPTLNPESPIISNYFQGTDTTHIPLLAFIIPTLTWGLLIVGIFGCAFMLAALFRKQWVQHERLSYPLAMIPLELVAPPLPGQYYNRLWRNGLLWAGAALPALVYGLSGLHALFPNIPFMSLSYNFSSAFTEHPWDRIPHYLVENRLYFSVIGFSFFIPSEVGLSLWLFLVANGLLRVGLATRGIDPGELEPIRGMGIYFGYFAGILWLARYHLWHVLRSAWYGTAREPAEVASYRALLVTLACCMALAWCWMIFLGIGPGTAALVLGMGLMLITLMSRIAAETGLFFLGTSWQITRFLEVLVGPNLMQTSSYYLSGLVSNVFFADLRETLMPYAVTSSRLSQETDTESRPKFFRWCITALLVSILVSGLVTHLLSYHYGRQLMRDNWAVNTVPSNLLSDAQRFHYPSTITPGQAWTHFGVGLGMVGAMMAARVFWVSWPFHPIGLLLMNAWPLQFFWFSIFVGWGLKQLLLHYGGAPLFRRARAFFIGLLVGEMLAAGLWMLLGLLTNGFIRFRFLPS